MKTQIRNPGNRAALLLATLLGLGLAAVTHTAATATEQRATKTQQPIIAYSKVLKAVEQRPDFGVIEAVRYDTRARAWNFRYMKHDGLPTVVKIDAVTGEPVTMVGEVQQ